MQNLQKQNGKSLLPNIDEKSEILILGSMPGIKSLAKQQYYAHPQNRFWKLMWKFCNTDNLDELNYKDKLRFLLKNKIALWDVIQSCDRNGSMDSNIQNEIPNNIPNLLKQFPNIKVICLNGNKSYSVFKKHFSKLHKQYNCYKLPSTSPANAGYKLENLYKEWSVALNKILKFK
jgi:hypoxanthine-DNA glycosylase